MSQEAAAIYALAGAILVYAVLWFFKSPKEVSGELAREIKELSRVTAINSELTVRHDERIVNLINSIKTLTERLDRIEPMVKGNGRRA